MFGSTRPALAPTRPSLTVVLGLACALGATLAPAPAAADVVVLSGGGEVRGEFVGDPDAGDAVAVRTATGATIRVPRAEVRRWAYRDAGREAFERRFDRTPPDPDAWWELAEWALQNRLRPERERALRALVRLDPQHEDAHLALGHKRDRDEWLTPMEWRRRNGLVLYGRRAVTPEEKALLEAADARDEAQKEWFRQVRLWLRELNDPTRAGGARAELLRVDDPNAIPAMRQFLSDDSNSAVRMTYVETLSRMPETTPVAALVRQALGDVDDLIREQAIRALDEETAPRDGPARAGAAQNYLRESLRSDQNVTVRRAAAALGELGDLNAVPDLIRSLITSHTYKVAVRDESGASGSVGGGGSIGGGLGAGGGGLSADTLLAIRSQYPGARIHQAPGPVRTRQVTVRVEHRNPETLSALQEIVGRYAPADAPGFAPPATYDEAAWAAWWARHRALFAGL